MFVGVYSKTHTHTHTHTHIYIYIYIYIYQHYGLVFSFLYLLYLPFRVILHEEIGELWRVWFAVTWDSLSKIMDRVARRRFSFHRQSYTSQTDKPRPRSTVSAGQTFLRQPLDKGKRWFYQIMTNASWACEHSNHRLSDYFLIQWTQ